MGGVPDEILADSRISWKAKGLLAALLANEANGVKTTVARLVEQGADGRESVRAGLAELEDAGYLARARARQEHSQFGRTDYRLIIPGRPS